jgi:hypothetical protein
MRRGTDARARFTVVSDLRRAAAAHVERDALGLRALRTPVRIGRGHPAIESGSYGEVLEGREGDALGVPAGTEVAARLTDGSK